MSIIVLVSKTHAKMFDLEIVAGLEADKLCAFSYFESDGHNVGLIIENDTYFSVVFDIVAGNPGNHIAGVLDADVTFTFASNSSETAKIRTITEKAKSLYSQYSGDIEETQSRLNGIPWKFLGYSMPVELKQHRT